MFSGLAMTRPMPMRYLGGLGGLGDIPIAAWQAGTLISYEKDGVVPNSFSTYKDSNIQSAFAASGLFVPNTVVFTSSANFLGLTYKIHLQGVLPVTVNQADVSHVIEGLLKNFYASGGTAVYSPAPNATQSVNASSGQVTASNNSPAANTSSDSDSHGISFIMADVQAGDYDVIFNDGSSGVFDENGNFYNGNQGGIRQLQISVDDSSQDDGFVAIMNDGTEVYFDLNGGFLYSFNPASSQLPNSVQTVPGSVNTVRTVPNLNNQNPKGSSVDQLLAGLGLSKVPLSLGVGGGVVLAGLAVGAYLVLSKK